MPLKDTKTAEAADKKSGMTVDELAKPRIKTAKVNIAVTGDSK